MFLETLGTVIVPATNEQFVAQDNFKINTGEDALVRIRYMGPNFIKWFLSEDGKIEEPIGQQRLRCHRLLRSSPDESIIAELGGEGKSETTLAELFCLMKGQGNGEDGVLLNDYQANIFYVRDSSDVLRTVIVRWDDFGWSVGASLVEDRSSWYRGRQVFSRSSP